MANIPSLRTRVKNINSGNTILILITITSCPNLIGWPWLNQFLVWSTGTSKLSDVPLMQKVMAEPSSRASNSPRCRGLGQRLASAAAYATELMTHDAELAARDGLTFRL